MTNVINLNSQNGEDEDTPPTPALYTITYNSNGTITTHSVTGFVSMGGGLFMVVALDMRILFATRIDLLVSVTSSSNETYN